MDPDLAAPDLGKFEWVAAQRRWTHGWRRLVPAAVFLVYLIFVAVAVNRYSHGSGRIAGYAILAVFVASYGAMLLQAAASPSWVVTSWRFWVPYGLLLLSFGAELPFAHAAGFVLCLYITSISVARFGWRSAPIVGAFAIAALLVPVAVSSWHDSLATAFDDVTPVAVPVVALVTFAILRIQRSNQALVEAHVEIARLSAENERSRIARDLHDLLGHSLTTITMKAGLARRVAGADPGRAAQEIAEVEQLSRRALAEVRAVVSNYREVTLAGELARGKELLRVSGITADLPSAADQVGGADQELFGWAVREGLTNVARHAHATACRVSLSDRALEIVDNGVGGLAVCGHGLAGLKERVAAAGGTLEAGPVNPHGWRLRVSLDRGPMTTT